jgi:hypothetical protein
MFFKLLRALLVVAALAGFSFLFSTCGTATVAPTGPSSQTPVVPPTTPAQVPFPIVLKFPAPHEVTIDFSTRQLGTTPSINMQKIVGPGGDYSEEISYIYSLLRFFEDTFFLPVLTDLSYISVPISVTQTTFVQTIDFSDNLYPDSFAKLHGLHEIKIDFGGFDYDGINGTEGCHGNTAQLPVCVRMWVDGERYLAWVFETYYYPDDSSTPQDEHVVGKGKYKLYKSGIDPNEPTSSGSVSVGNTYDQQTLENRNLEIFSSIDSYENGVLSGNLSHHFLMTQDGPASTAKKGIDLHYSIETAINALIEYKGRLVEGEDYWSGSSHVDNPIGTSYSFTDVCAFIPTGDVADQLFCENLGIRVFNEAFIRDVQASDFTIPITFPAAPTF